MSKSLPTQPAARPGRSRPKPTAVPSSEDALFAAFCARMTEAEPVILACARRAGIDPDDIVARTWIRGWERCGDLATLPARVANLKAYLVRIAERLIADTLRRDAAAGRVLAGAATRDGRRRPNARRRRTVSSTSNHAGPALVCLDRAIAAAPEGDLVVSPLYAAAGSSCADPHVQIELRARENAVNQAIARLPSSQRIAIEDLVDQVPASETACALGIGRSATYEHLARARVSLAADLAAAGISVPAPAYTRRSTRRDA